MKNNFVLGNLVLLATIAFAVPNAHAANESQRLPELRSAFLGPAAWGNVPLTSAQISHQLKTHFGKVLRILDDQSEASLNEAVTVLDEAYGPFDDAKAIWVKRTLAGRRAWQVRTLIEYANRGRFPLNEDHAVDAVPIFVDNHQTHCAVGYLMHRSGHDAAVAEVVETNNLVFVKDATEGRLVDWIMFSGLTQDEAALIQPAYDHSVPAADATLSQFFANPNFSYRENGLTVSDLRVRTYAFDAGSSQDFESIYAQGVFGVNRVRNVVSSGLSVAIGRGPYDSAVNCFMCEYTPGFDDWMFLKGPLNLGQGNASMHRIDYRVQANEGLSFSQISLGASGIYDPSFVGSDGYLRVVTEAYDADGVFLDEGRIDADGADYFFGGLEFLETDNNNELLITNYVLDYGESNFGEGYRSHWQGFGLTAIPEPATSTLFLLAACGMVGRRRR